MNNFEIKHKFPTTKQFVSLFESVGWERDKKRVNQNRKNNSSNKSLPRQINLFRK